MGFFDFLTVCISFKRATTSTSRRLPLVVFRAVVPWLLNCTSLSRIPLSDTELLLDVRATSFLFELFSWFFWLICVCLCVWSAILVRPRSGYVRYLILYVRFGSHCCHVDPYQQGQLVLDRWLDRPAFELEEPPSLYL